MFIQTPYLLVVIIALWTGTLLFLSLHLRTANSYALMLAGYTLPLIALPVVDNPLAVWDVAEARTEEIFLGIAVAAIVGAMFWPRRLMPVFDGSVAKWFADAQVYSQRFLTRNVAPEEISTLRGGMVATFNTLELMIGQLPHEGARPQTVRNTKELRGRMIHLLPVIDALDDAIYAIEHRAPEFLDRFTPLLQEANAWLDSTTEQAPWNAGACCATRSTPRNLRAKRWTIATRCCFPMPCTASASGSTCGKTAAACKPPSSAKARTPGAPCTATGAWAGSRRSSTVA